MPLNAQDLWVVLKAQDLATRALNSYSRAVRKAGLDTKLAQIDAALGALANQRALLDLARATEQAAIANSRNEISMMKMILAQKTTLGLSAAQVKQIEDEIAAREREILIRQGNINKINNETISLQRSSLALKQEGDAARLSAARLAEHQRQVNETSARYKAFAQSAYAASFAITAVGIVGAAALKKAMDSASDYEKQVSLTFTQVEKGQATLKELGRVGIDVADTVGVKFSEVQESLYNIFSSTNANLAQSKVLLAAFAKAAVAGQVSMDDASKGTMAILNAFQIPLEDVNKVLDIQFQLVRKGVGTYADFNSVMGRIVPSAVRAGANIKDVGAMLAFMTRNGLSAAMAATSGARALDALSNPKSLSNLEKFGIKMKDAKGNFMPLIDIITQLSTKLSGLSQTARAAKLTALFKGGGGTIQAMRFLNMVTAPGQLKNFQGFLDDMSNATGQFGDAYDEMANTTVTKTQLLKNRFQDLKITVGNAVVPYFLRVLDIVNRAIGYFSRLDPKIKTIIAKFLIFATAAALIIGPIVGILGIVGSLASALAALGLTLSGTLAIIAGGVLVLAGIGVGIYDLWQNSQEFRDTLYDLGQTGKQVFTDLKDFFKGVKDSFDKNLKPTLEHLWLIIEGNIIPAIKHLVDVWRENWEKNLKDTLKHMREIVDQGFKYISDAITNYLIPALNQATTFYYEHQQAIDTVIKYLMMFGKWVAIIIGGAVLGALIVMLVSAIVTISGFINYVKTAGDMLFWWIGVIKWVVAQAWTYIKDLGGMYKWLYDTIKHWIEGAISDLQKLKDKPVQMFSDAKSLLMGAGRDLIQGLINGVTGELGHLTRALNTVWNAIPSTIKHALGMSSPSKLFHKFGQYTVQGFINGINSMSRELVSAMSSMSPNPATTTGSWTQQGWQDSAKMNSSNMNSNGTNVVVNVQTNEIRPEYHAARLGQLLVGRIA